MKTIFTILGLVVAITIIFLLAGGNTADAPTDTVTSTDEVATSTEAQLEGEVSDGTYAVDTDASTVTWEAEKSFVDGYTDAGFIPVSDGTITVVDGVIATSSIVLNAADITATEVSNVNYGSDQLTNHLRSDDFFATEEFPEASFTITSVESIEGSDTTYDVTGDLTIKGEVNEITFPAEIGMSDEGLVVSASAVIDRTKWGIRFGSPSFFNDLGDSAIADEVSIKINLVADTTSETDAE